MTEREPDPADRRWFEVSHEEFERIQDELARPAKFLPRLAAFLRGEES